MSGVEEREKGGQETGEGRGRACVCGVGSGVVCVCGGGRGEWGVEKGHRAERVKCEGKERHEECACERV